MQAPTPAGVTRIVPTMVRLPEEKHAALKQVAAAHHRSLQGELSHIIDRWLDAHPEQENGVA